MSGDRPVDLMLISRALRINRNDLSQTNCKNEDIRFAKYDYALKLKNGVVLCFDEKKENDPEGIRGTVLIEDGQVNIYNAMGLHIFGGKQNDNIQLINSDNCSVNVKGGGYDDVKLNNRGKHGKNVVRQDEKDETKLIPTNKKPRVDLDAMRAYKKASTEKAKVDALKDGKLSSVRFWTLSKTIKGEGTIDERDY